MIYSIKAGENFISNFAKAYLQRYDHISKSRKTRIFFPTKRSYNDFLVCYEKISGKKFKEFASSFGDFTSEELRIVNSYINNVTVISSMRLKMIITTLLQEKIFFYQENFEKSFQLASSLEKLYLELIENEINFDLAFKEILIYSNKQNERLKIYLEIILYDLPNYLTKHNLIDNLSYFQKILFNLAKFWQKKPPNHDIIIVAPNRFSNFMMEFYKIINSFKNSIIILRNINKNHKKYFEFREYFTQLKSISNQQEIIENWYNIDTKSNDNCIFAESFFVNDDLSNISISEENVTIRPNIELVSCKDEFETSNEIANRLKFFYDQNMKIGLATHDRELAKKLHIIFKNLGININDSNGKDYTIAGIFLKLCLEIVKYNFSDSSLLALLKHPYTCFGKNPVYIREEVRKLEIDKLRQTLFNKSANKTETILEKKIAELTNHFRQLISRKTSLHDLIIEHLNLASKIATILDEDNNEQIIIWQNEEDKQLKELLEDLINSPESGKEIEKYSYFQIYDNIVKNDITRKIIDVSDKIFILTPEEASLSEFDYIIIKDDCNKNLMDSLDSTWLNTKIRANLNLTTIEEALVKDQEIIFSLISTTPITIIHNLNENGQINDISKLFLKLKTILSKFDSSNLYKNSPMKILDQKFDDSDKIIQASSQIILNNNNNFFIKFNQTQIQNLIQDPYGFYAKNILKLNKINKLDNQFFSTDFGILTHKIIQKTLLKDPYNIKKLIINFSEEMLGSLRIDRSIKKIWLHKLTYIAEFLEKNIQGFDKIYTEITGSILINNLYKIEAKADLIIETQDNIKIIDFKTGNLPPYKLVKNGLFPQLAIEGLIALKGGFGNLKCDSKRLELLYMKLSGKEIGGEIMSITDPEIIIKNSDEGINQLLNLFDKNDNYYEISPYFAYDIYNFDYRYLSRIEEIR